MRLRGRSVRLSTHRGWKLEGEAGVEINDPAGIRRLSLPKVEDSVCSGISVAIGDRGQSEIVENVVEVRQGA